MRSQPAASAGTTDISSAKSRVSRAIVHVHLVSERVDQDKKFPRFGAIFFTLHLPPHMARRGCPAPVWAASKAQSEMDVWLLGFHASLSLAGCKQTSHMEPFDVVAVLL